MKEITQNIVFVIAFWIRKDWIFQTLQPFFFSPFVSCTEKYISVFCRPNFSQSFLSKSMVLSVDVYHSLFLVRSPNWVQCSCVLLSNWMFRSIFWFALTIVSLKHYLIFISFGSIWFGGSLFSLASIHDHGTLKGQVSIGLLGSSRIDVCISWSHFAWGSIL